MGKLIVNVEVVPKTATEPGALDGWAVLCSLCGKTGGSSLRGMADQLAMEHRHFHMVRDAEELVDMQMAIANEVRLMLWRVVSIDTSEDDLQNDAGQLGNVLNALLNPDHPEARENLAAIRAGVRMFLQELSGNNMPGDYV